MIAGYARLSIAKDTSASIESQTAMLQRYAEAHGEELTLYIDDGFSGSKDIERPAYERMLAAIRSGLHDTVVVKSVDRLSRRLRGFLELADEARVITIEGGLDTGTPTGRMMLSLLSTFAQFEADAMSQRQLVSQKFRREQGRAMGLAPYGYRHEEREDGTWRVIDDHEAHVIRDLADALLSGASFRSLADQLNEQGERTRRGNLWSAATVGKVMSNPQIAGMRVHDNDVLRGDNGLPIIDDHLAIVSMTEWSRMEEARAKRRVVQTRTTDPLLLQGIAVCASCGRYMTRQTHTLKGHEYRNYACTADTRTRCPSRPHISQRKLDNYIKELLAPLMSMPIYETIRVEDPIALDQRALIQREIDALAASISTANSSDIADISERITSLRRQHDEIVVETIEEQIDTGKTGAELWETDPRFVVEQAIEEIQIKPAGEGNTRADVKDRVDVIFKS